MSFKLYLNLFIDIPQTVFVLKLVGQSGTVEIDRARYVIVLLVFSASHRPLQQAYEETGPSLITSPSMFHPPLQIILHYPRSRYSSVCQNFQPIILQFL